MIFPAPKKTLIKMLGPSVAFVALSLNGGEMILWPDLVGKYGLWILWIVPLILILQFFVNIEIERYTAATGQNTVTALLNKYKFFKIMFPIAIITSLIWPGWISNSGNLLAYISNLPSFGAHFSAGLMLVLLTLWFSKKSYNLVEMFAKIGLSGVLLIGCFVLLKSFGNITPSVQMNFFPAANDRILYLSALAFGGVSGVLNLVQSEWIQSKEYGAGNPSTKIDWNNSMSIVNWKKWWKLITQEHFILFYIGNLVGIFLIALVAFFTISGQNKSGFSLLIFQIDYLNNLFGLGWLWGIGIFLLFFLAQMTILDAAGRLLNHSFKKIEKSKLSQIFGLFGFFILIITIFYPSFNQPAFLLQISASISAFIMAIYPIFLLKLNLNNLPPVAKPKLINIIGVICCSLFYLAMSIWAVLGSFI